jgi:hypothetical protein
MWVWCPNKHKAYLRGYLYIDAVQYAGIPNQNMVIQDAPVQIKGDATYPHSSIVALIERGVELENAEADVMQVDKEFASAPGEPISLTLVSTLPAPVAEEFVSVPADIVEPTAPTAPSDSLMMDPGGADL